MMIPTTETTSLSPKVAPDLKVAIAQIKTQPGQIAQNVKEIIKALDQARAAEAGLVVFPELTIPAYGAMDLLFNKSYLEANKQALEEIAPYTKGLTAIIGFADFEANSKRAGSRLNIYNSAAIFKDGELVAIRDKSLLPNYNIFYEDRYFAPARERKIVDLGEVKLGIQICEDLWSEDYSINPTQDLIRQGANLIINLSASPFNVGKLPVRYALLSETAQKVNTPIVYANLVGCYDGYEGEVVFDGRSLATNASGQIISQAKGFEEDLALVQPWKDAPIDLPTVDRRAELYDALILGIKDYFARLNRALPKPPKAIIGVSGGIDSALVAALAVAAIGKENVMGVTLPSRFNSEATKNDAYDLCKNLGIPCDTVAIEDMRLTIEKSLLASNLGLFGSEMQSLTSENIQARARMLSLMAYANSTSGIVLNTGNKTELALDNCTIYGDMVGGFSVLGDVDKDRVYELANYINEKAGREIIPSDTITRVATAELKENQIDADVMGAAPQLIAPLVRSIVENNLSFTEALERHSEEFNPELIRNTYKKLERSEWKRRQAAPAIRVTPQAFGVGRRVPIIHGYLD